MLKKILSSFLSSFLLLSSIQSYADGLVGLWQATDRSDENPGCVVLFYKYEPTDLFYGRIVATYDAASGKIDEVLGTTGATEPKKRAPGVDGEPLYCGLDMIWDLTEDGNTYDGSDARILDPEKGKTYRVELEVDGDRLSVTGKLLVFSGTHTWRRLKPADVPGFKMPKDLVPNIPEVK